MGGAVRDHLLGLPLADLDFATSDARRMAAALAQRLRGRVVPLHDAPVTVRVVAVRDEPRVEFDFVEVPEAIEADLARRDFTLNAAALRLWPEPPELVDPYGAAAAARERALAVVREQSLEADPVRLIRAYRLAAQCELTIEERTRMAIAARAPLITTPAAERIWAELLKMLSCPTGAAHLRLMADDGLLAALVPELAEGKGVFQGGYHHLDVWQHSVQVAIEAEQVINAPEGSFGEHASEVAAYLALRDKPAAVKLAALLHDVGKPRCCVWHEGRYRFFEHDKAGAELAGRIGRRLHVPSRIMRTVVTIVANHMRPLQLWSLASLEEPSPRAVRRLFRDTHGETLGLLIVALADRAACLGPASDPEDAPRLAQAFRQMLSIRASLAVPHAPKRLLRGRDLIREFALEPGPRFGTLLDAVEEARELGQVTTREEAVALVRLLLDEPGDSL